MSNKLPADKKLHALATVGLRAVSRAETAIREANVLLANLQSAAYHGQGELEQLYDFYVQTGDIEP